MYYFSTLSVFHRYVLLYPRVVNFTDKKKKKVFEAPLKTRNRSFFGKEYSFDVNLNRTTLGKTLTAVTITPDN